MVPGAEGDTDERQVALDRDLGHRGKRAVAPRGAERLGGSCSR